ncbi:hypothetical protein, partial [uncultured Gammaproteobacteria bacterium]
TSARTGAIYALYELAIEEEKYRRQIAQILCSHIRSKTDEAEYQKTHSERPSNEIQTTINYGGGFYECMVSRGEF